MSGLPRKPTSSSAPAQGDAAKPPSGSGAMLARRPAPRSDTPASAGAARPGGPGPAPTGGMPPWRPRHDRSAARPASPPPLEIPRPADGRTLAEPYSSSATFDRMVPTVSTVPSSRPARWLAQTDASVSDWRKAAQNRAMAAQPGRPVQKHSSAETPPQVYPMIWGHDRDGVGKVIVAQRGWVNEFTAQDGERVAQQPAPVEMRGPGQIGLPGGKAVNPRNLVASAADEALAETGINVRNGRFTPFEPIEANDRTGHRAHVLFHYQGDIEQLAARSDAVVRGRSTADNELSAVRALTPKQAWDDMSNSYRDAKKIQGAKRLVKRFSGDGQDWHQGPLDVLSRLMSQGRPAIESPRAASAASPAALPGGFGPIVAPGTAGDPQSVAAAAAAGSVELHPPSSSASLQRSNSVVAFEPIKAGHADTRNATASAAAAHSASSHRSGK